MSFRSETEGPKSGGGRESKEVGSAIPFVGSKAWHLQLEGWRAGLNLR